MRKFYHGTKGLTERGTKTAFRSYRRHISGVADKVPYELALAMWRKAGEPADYNPRPISL